MKWIKIHERDNVAVALEDLELKTEVGIEFIKKGHKFALINISQGAAIIKYGYQIGVAKTEIKKGSWVHVHNVTTSLKEQEHYKYEERKMVQNVNHRECDFFQGYRRADGQCGIRNEIWVISTVGCVNSVAENITNKVRHYSEGKVDGLHTFTHPYGCSQMGEDQENTLKALVAFANHPNVAGVLFLGLGCENCNFQRLKNILPKTLQHDNKRIKWLACQDVVDEEKVGIELLKLLIDQATAMRRESISTDELVVGLKCGGSDGLSGLTANPLVGMFSDKLCKQGGSVILTEVPEMFGAEKLLMKRCKDKVVFDKAVDLINNFKTYFSSHGQVIYENPSPGNKDGGITTLEDKSLGCIQKGGDCVVTDVLQYGENLQTKGLNLLAAPGNDLVASTALALSGAQLILFTTGRGTPMGAPVPTIKISSNHQLYQRKSGWMDYDAEKILEAGDKNIIANDFYQYVLEVASGKKTKSEKNGFCDIALFKQGVTL